MPLNFGGHAGETEAARRIREEREAQYARNRRDLGLHGKEGTFDYRQPGAMSPGAPNLFAGGGPGGMGFQSGPGFGGMPQMGGGAFPGYGMALRNSVAPTGPGGVTPIGPDWDKAATGLGDINGGGLGGALKGVLGGIGDKVGGAVDWLTDEDQGYLRQLLLTNAIGTAGSIYSANKQGAIEDEERERRERVRASYGPALKSVL